VAGVLRHDGSRAPASARSKIKRAAVVYELKLFLLAALVALSTAVVLRPSFRELLPGKEYSTVWKVVGLTLGVSFLSTLTLVFFVGLALTAFVGVRMLGGDLKARISIFLMMILLYPPVSQSLGGVGDINHLFILDPVHALSLLILGPAAFRLLIRKRIRAENPFRLVDGLLIAYQALQLVLLFRNLSATAVLRFVFEATTTTLLPYYVMTRGLKSVEDLKFVAKHMMIAFVFLAAIGVAEEAAGRGIYGPLAFLYGVKWQLTSALMRGGFLRVQATTPEPIVLAFLIIAALGLWTWLAGSTWKSFRSMVVYGLLIAALAFTWSRGPWIGAVVFAISLGALRFCSARVYTIGLAATACLVVFAKASGTDQVFYDFLKSIFGSSQEDFGTIEYRRQILDAALALIQQSPLFGVSNYAAYLQQFKQGEGIVDLVNTYLIIGLESGIAGLSLYLIPHLVVFFKLVSRLISPTDNATHDRFVQAFASSILAMMFTLITTSTTGIMPQILLAWIALPLVYMRHRVAALPIEGNTDASPVRLSVDFGRIG
jgi:hypothetical protein